ncbi:hypothetical protein EDB19DRAFT_1024769 [Suillus lakei]|nr:hypothetical protein EDB19DRAFT_1024769 [Suillus lakei]
MDAFEAGVQAVLLVVAELLSYVSCLCLASCGGAQVTAGDGYAPIAFPTWNAHTLMDGQICAFDIRVYLELTFKL